MTPLRAALFDFDGTLCDSIATIIRLVQLACEEIGVPVPTTSTIRGNIGRGFENLAEDYTGGDDQLAAQLFQTYRQINSREIAAGQRQPEPLYDGAREALASLQAEGWLTGIVTNKGRAGLDYLLEAHNLKPLLDVSLTVDEVTPKPAPDMALEAMRRLGSEKLDTLLIGDTEIDAGCAANAGIGFVGVGWDCHGSAVLETAGARAILPDFDQLPLRLEQALGAR